MKKEKIDRKLFERHGFVTFWLILGLIGCIINPILLILEDYDFEELEVISYIAYNIISFTCIILIFKWKIFGFYIYSISTIAIIIFLLLISDNFYIEDAIPLVILTIIEPIVLFAILLIKKNRLSSWDYLKGVYPKNYKPKTDVSIQDALKCKSCGKIFSSGYTSCPHCNFKNIVANTNILSTNVEVSNEYNPLLKSALNEVTKKCKKCGEKVNENIYKCTKCKGDSFV